DPRAAMAASFRVLHPRAGHGLQHRARDLPAGRDGHPDRGHRGVGTVRSARIDHVATGADHHRVGVGAIGRADFTWGLRRGAFRRNIERWRARGARWRAARAPEPAIYRTYRNWHPAPVEWTRSIA